MGSLLVVNLHGQINIPQNVLRALSELGVERRFSATIVRDDDSTLGALRLSKDYVAWSEVDQELLGLLLEKRGKVSHDKKLDHDALQKIGFKTYGALSKKILKEGLKLSSIEGMKSFFALSPPKGGFKKSTRRPYAQNGTLGMNPTLPEIVKRMV